MENKEKTVLLLLETHLPGSRLSDTMRCAGGFRTSQAREWEKAAEIFKYFLTIQFTDGERNNPGLTSDRQASHQRDSFALKYIPNLTLNPLG